MKQAYYNEIDKFAAQTLRNLIAAGHIAPGDVDERSIEDVHPSDLKPYTQCHFFAGISVWAYALRRAGWPDDRPVWTGSCPCQPFSSAGAGAGFDDERHLWPAFFHLIEQRRPAAILGEQVASKDADPWIDLVQDDMEAVGYVFGAVPFPSAGVGAPHIRDRLYWMAYANSSIGRQGRPNLQGRASGSDAQPWSGLGSCSMSGRLDHTHNSGLEGLGVGHQASFGHGQGAVRSASTTGESSGLADTQLQQRQAGQSGVSDVHDTRGRQQSTATLAGFCSDSGRPGPTNGLWANADWLLCRDGKWRPVEPGTFPLAHGAPARVGRLRAYGNAINAEAARVFIEAAMSCIP